ncbi:MAG TPA: TolC family protein [Candidatus Acidoferrum sp.]|nr:TolC family protein [Candidatus Acidoferrum sp.]
MNVFGNRHKYWITATAVLFALVATRPAYAQTQASEPAKRTFTLDEAVEFALKNYPAVRVSLERSQAAEAGVGVALTSYLPRTDILWQTNRATDNNITGLTMPNTVIAPITGPVPLSPSNQSAWGSAGGLLFSWEPLDFGSRGAKVDAARAARNRASAEASLTRLDVTVATVNTYLTLVAAGQTVRAAQADVERRETFTKSVHVLVDNQLRAGADASRADAELARARVNLARAEQQAATSRAALANILGIADQIVEVQETALLNTSPTVAPPAALISANPAAEAQRARVQESQSLVHALDRSYYPKFYLQSVVMGRGSGVDPTGKFLGGSEGLGPDRANWATGVTVFFPMFDIFSIKSKKAVEAANERAEEARYDQELQDLTGQLRSAQASLEGARKVAENTPLELEAARTTETQERARYQAGLATLVDVSDAQSFLVRAEIDDALARLAVWQNLASVAAAQGDLAPFLKSLHDAAQGAR